MSGALGVCLLATLSSSVPVMHDETRALTLDVRQQGDAIEVALIGQSPQAREVSYLLEVSGQSNSRHRGKTTLAANTRAVLSTIRVTAGPDWCVRLIAEEEGGTPYEIREGNCPDEED